MPRVSIVAAAFFALFFVSVAVVTLMFLPVVERDILEKITLAMDKSDGEVADLVVDVRGRDVIVMGTVRRKAHLEGVLRGLRELPGVASVENKLRWVPMDPWLLVARNADGSLQVTGQVKDRAEKARLSVAVRESDEEIQLEHKARIDDDIREATWMEKLGRSLPELMAMDAVKSISVRDGKVEVKGDVYSDSTADATMGLVAAVFEGLDFRMDSDLRVVPPPLAPWIEIKKESPGKLAASGTLRSTKQRHEIIGIAASELAEGASISNLIETGGNVALAEWWGSVVTVLPAVLAEMQPCEIEIRDS
ncbi:MAG: BON domain-containing protein, partial [Verrucomicrobiota bacterium]